MKVGFIGWGEMGSGMASNILKRANLTRPVQVLVRYDAQRLKRTGSLGHAPNHDLKFRTL